MLLSDADKEDAGNYKIEAINDSGSASCEVGVKVKGKLDTSTQLYLEFGY